jgi:aminoglycoside 6'-N-acetyltransferase I
MGWAKANVCKTWELHPLVIDKQYQNKGIGKLLLKRIEEKAKEKDIIGILLGTDDEMNRTSLSQHEITESNIFDEILNITNLKRHPYEFYQKCGYTIIGIIPNANGLNKPDIWMWKNLL